VERAQDKVLQMQARANAMDELTQSGTLPEIGSGDALDRQLAQISSQSDVDNELAKLKVQMQLPEPETGQAQLPPPTN
jgi:phage shock protein A